MPHTLTIAYMNTSGRPMNFYGTSFDVGQLVVGMEDEANVSSVMREGYVSPVVLESLPKPVQDEYAAAYASLKGVSAPEVKAPPVTKKAQEEVTEKTS